MKHSFLLEEGLWLAKGTYYGADNKPVGAEGETRVTHEEGKWMNVSSLKLSYQSKTDELRNSYQVVPVPPGAGETKWEAMNPVLGKLNGRFMFVEDCIISTYESESGQYSGTEIVLQQDINRYLCRGVACKGGQKVAAWSFELTRS